MKTKLSLSKTLILIAEAILCSLSLNSKGNLAFACEAGVNLVSRNYANIFKACACSGTLNFESQHVFFVIPY